MKIIYNIIYILFYEYFIYETCWTLNLLYNQIHKSKQIWGWYLNIMSFQ